MNLVELNNWKEFRLDEIFDISRGGSPRPIKDFITELEDGYNWIKIGDTKNVDKYIYSTKQKIRKEGLKKSVLVKEDDFILSNSMSFGKPYIMKTEGCIHDGWLLMRRKSKDLSIDYMYYLLSSDVIKNQFKSKAAGSTVLNLSIKLVSTVKALIPSHKEQQKIALILNTVDAKIEVIDQQISETQELKKGLMQRLFTKGIGHTGFKDSPLGDIPNSWEVKNIEEFVESFTGGASLKPSDFVDLNGFSVIPKKAVSSGGVLKIDNNNPTYCTLRFADSNKGYIVNKNYIITTLRDLVPSGPSIGYMVKYDSNNEYILAQGVYGFTVSSKICKDYLIQYSNTITFRKVMQKIKVGSTQVHIRNKDYMSVSIPFPPIQEQQEISTILNSVFEKLEVLLEKKTIYQELKKGLMQQLLTRKVRVKV